MQRHRITHFFATMAPLTASSISASSKTTNGAFPPSSSDVRRTRSADSNEHPAHPAEPVNETFLTRGSCIIREIIALVCSGITKLPSHLPAPLLAVKNIYDPERGQRCPDAAFKSYGALQRRAGPNLASSHSRRKVPRCYQ
jgi:hypothetical protein